jgi:hypothetical protein
LGKACFGGRLSHSLSELKLVKSLSTTAEYQLAFLTMTNIRHFWVASNFHYPMQTIKTIWKPIFQNKLTIYKANLPSFVQKIIKSRCYVDLSLNIAQTYFSWNATQKWRREKG